VEDVYFTLPAGPADLGVQARLAEPAQVRVHLDGDASVVRADVAADLRLRCSCDRCLEDVRLELSVVFAEEWRLATAAREARGGREAGAGADDGAPDPADDDEAVVRRTIADQTVGLTDAFWQNAALALPAKVLCAEDCRGLCPRCGANLNRTSCTCAEPAPDTRLAALGRWRPDTRR